MPVYTSEIVTHNSYPDVDISKVLLVTKKTNQIWEKDTLPDEENRYLFSSSAELREYLIKEKFNTEIARWGGKTLRFLGTGFFASIAIKAKFPETPLINSLNTQDLFWVSALAGALNISLEKYGQGRDKINSQVKAFEKTFPDLKPIKFSPREYFLTGDRWKANGIISSVVFAGVITAANVYTSINGNEPVILPYLIVPIPTAVAIARDKLATRSSQ